jgi:hypothetical protein
MCHSAQHLWIISLCELRASFASIARTPSLFERSEKRLSTSFALRKSLWSEAKNYALCTKQAFEHNEKPQFRLFYFLIFINLKFYLL